jgi:hypothetical protein
MAHYTFAAVTRLLAALAVVLPSGVLAQAMVGPETCKACHPAAYEAWLDSAHARALDRLPPESRRDHRCTACHAPELEKGVTAVTCETCHGPGQVYAVSHVMRDPELARLTGLVDPGERTCLRCHTENAPSLTRFDYATRLRRIAHGGGRARLSAPPPAGPPRDGTARTP